MTIAPGTKLGPYEVVSRLGSGGMGEVYRARDTRLDRTVALKVLPESTARDEQARARFEREARAISALNHPNICTLFDVGTDRGVSFLVMELIEGQTLAELIARGRLPIGDALRHAIDIANALDRAHRQGIVHRDLKPGNVMITRTGVKLLDFGLARLQSRSEVTHDAPTVVNPITADGTILGTLQYMAPEQLEGKPVDARADLFALGCILYEMITGRRAFGGSSQASIISAIMTSEPPAIPSLVPVTPPQLDRLVRKCLAKSPDERWQSAGDLATELRWLVEERASNAASLKRPRRLLPWLIAAASLGIAAVALLAPRVTSPPPLVVARLSLPIDSETLANPRVSIVMAISPDGKSVVYTGIANGQQSLWYRPLSAATGTPIPNTAGGWSPTWSPDGKEIAFILNNTVRRSTPGGESASRVCEFDPAVIASLAWGPDWIVIGGTRDRSALLRVRPSGGKPERVAIGPVPDKHWVIWPRFDRTGKIVYALLSAAPNLQLHRVSIDGGDDHAVGDLPSRFELVGDTVVYGSEGALFAQKIDRDFKRLGEPSLLARGVFGYYATNSCSFSASATSIIFVGSNANRRATWFDAEGKILGAIGPVGASKAARISHDGRRVILAAEDPIRWRRDLWLCDVARGTTLRITDGNADNEDPVFSPDDSSVAYASGLDGPPQVSTIAATGGQPTRVTVAISSPQVDEDWARNGRAIMFTSETPGTGDDIWITQPAPQSSARLWLQSPFNDRLPRISPDGNWVAYASDETGHFEVYVARLDKSSERVQVSNGGAMLCAWSPDGRTLYYASDTKLYAVTMTYTPALDAGQPRLLFSDSASAWEGLDVSPDGSRFLINRVLSGPTTAPLNVIVNWQQFLEKK